MNQSTNIKQNNRSIKMNLYIKFFLITIMMFVLTFCMPKIVFGYGNTENWYLVIKEADGTETNFKNQGKGTITIKGNQTVFIYTTDTQPSHVIRLNNGAGEKVFETEYNRAENGYYQWMTPGTYHLYLYGTGQDTSFPITNPYQYVVITVTKTANPLTVSAVSGLKYNGSAKSLVTVNNPGSTAIYYSVGTQLTSSNYSSQGKPTIPTQTNAGEYTVYYYAPESTNYLAKSGSVKVSIAQATPSNSVKITGTPGVGNTLTATITTSNTGGTKSYQWWYSSSSTATSGTNISGATGSTYKMTSDVRGYYVGVTESVAATTNYIKTSSSAIASSATVKETPSFSVNKTSTSLLLGRTEDLTITYNGDGGLSATSANTSIATASISGKTLKITGKTVGNTTITVKAEGNTKWNAASTTVSVEVKKGNYSINGVHYLTLKNAVDVAAAGATIKVEQSNTDSSDAKISKNINLNIQNFTITKTSYPITVNNGITLSITGTGKITTSAEKHLIINNGILNISSVTLEHTSNSNNYRTINNASTGTVTINSGTVKANIYAINNIGKAYVKGGTVSANGTFDTGNVHALYTATGATTTVSGGTITATNNSTNASYGARALGGIGDKIISGSPTITAKGVRTIAIESYHTEALSTKIDITGTPTVTAVSTASTQGYARCVSAATGNGIITTIAVTISGGTYTATDPGATTNTRAVSSSGNKGEVKITGGTFNSDNYGILISSGSGKLTYGSSTVTLSTETPSVTGGDYGIYAPDGFNFHNGVIKGKNEKPYSGNTDLRGKEYYVFTTGPVSNIYSSYLKLDDIAPTINIKSTSTKYANKNISFEIPIVITDEQSGLNLESFNSDDITIKVNNVIVTPTTKNLLHKSTNENEYEYTLTLSGVTGDGLLTIEFANGVIEDKVGNGNAATSMVNTIIIDNTSPAVSLNGEITGSVEGFINSDDTITIPIKVTEAGGMNSSEFTKDDITLKINGTADNEAELKLDYINKTGNDYEYIITISNVEKEGTMTLEILENKITDFATNINKLMVLSTLNIKVDNTAPIVQAVTMTLGGYNTSRIYPTSLPIENNNWINESVYVVINATDDGTINSGIMNYYHLLDDEEGFVNLSADRETWADEMNKKIYYRVEDKAGNISNIVEVTIKIDKTKPIGAELDMRQNRENGMAYDNTKISSRPIFIKPLPTNDIGLYQSGVSKTEYRIIFNNGVSETSTDLINGDTGTVLKETGTYRIEVITTDKAGNKSDVKEFTAAIETNMENTVKITNIHDQGSGVKKVIITAKRQGGTVDVIEPIEIERPSSTINERIKLTDGTFEITVQIIDGVGLVKELKQTITNEI